VNTEGIGDPGFFGTWDAGAIAGNLMIEDLVDLLVAQVITTTIYDGYTIYTMDSPTADPKPVYEAQLSVAGTVVIDPDIFDKAVQAMYTIRTADFGLFKFTQLDHASGNVFGNVFALAAAEQAIVDYFTDVSNGWAGRDGARPAVFSNQSISLNKRLRRSYHMI
jgi:hypothetical protein